MFEEEVQLENESKSLSLKSPFLYIFLLLLLVLGAIGYFVYRSDKALTAEDAKPVITSALKMRGPASVRFTVGTMKPSVTEKPRDPHYKLLEKLGYLKLANAKNDAVQVTLTPLGESTFKELPEFKKTARSDGTESLLVPLATRELVAIKSVTSTSPGNATVTYEWKWATNKVGEQFDTTSDAVQKFSQWDRTTLIKNYGVDFYKQTKTETVNMIRGKNGWQIANE